MSSRMLFLAALVALPLQAQSAPVPSEISSAKYVFISNGGGQSNSVWTKAVNAKYTGGPNRAYNELYASMQSWGRYTLVSSPSAADMSIEIRFGISALPEFMIHGGYDATDPNLRLVVRDVKTQTVLWTVTEHIGGNQDRDFDAAMGRLISDLEQLAQS